MRRRVSPADGLRKALTETVGEASLDFSAYYRLAGQAMSQAAMETQAADLIGRAAYAPRRPEPSGHRRTDSRNQPADASGDAGLDSWAVSLR